MSKKARIFVYNKKSVLDAECNVILKSLKRSFDVSSLSQGRYFDVELPDNITDPLPYLEEMCHNILVNEVIQDFKIEIIEQ